MKRSHLRNKFLNTRSDLDQKAFNKQRNYVFSLRKEKNNFIVIWTLTFWQKIEFSGKLFIADKTNKTYKITLIKEERVISQDHQIVKTFNDYSISIPIKICLKIKNMKALIH